MAVFTDFFLADITFRAWDQTDGANGDTGVEITATGGTTEYSSDTDTATLTVDAVNDARENTVPLITQVINEDGSLNFGSGTGNQIKIKDLDASESGDGGTALVLFLALLRRPC